MQFDDETFDPAPKVEEVEVFEDVPELTSRERAMVFFNRTQRMSMQSTESPAIRLLLEKRKLDEATATTQMKKTNDHTRMVGLQNRRNLDKIEREVLARLEAKHHGLIFGDTNRIVQSQADVAPRAIEQQLRPVGRNTNRGDCQATALAQGLGTRWTTT